MSGPPRGPPPPQKERVDPDLKDAVEHELAKHDFPPREPGRGVTGQCQCFGASGAGGTSAELEPRQAGLVRSLNALVDQVSKDRGLDFTWNSAQVNKNTVAAPHVDEGVTGRTAVFLLGTIAGGSLQLESGEAITGAGQLLVFDAGEKHFSGPLEGTRYSIV